MALPRDFVLYNTLQDGELETRIRYGNVTAKEVTVGRGLGLKFRQISDGRHLIHLIYSPSSPTSNSPQQLTLTDCDAVHDSTSISDFLQAWHRDVTMLTTQYNVSVLPLGAGVMPSEVHHWLSVDKMRKECKHRQEEVRRVVKFNMEQQKESKSNHSHSHKVSKRALTDMILPGTLWCGANDMASRYQDLGPWSSTDKCCRRHDHCRYNIPGFGQNFGLFNARPFTVSQCWCDRSWRGRRDASSLLLVPGTKWCGKGRSASRYTDMGMFSATDKCCRRHDSACPFWVAALDTKYGLFNWRVNTIMHCHCDERFRTCLKRVGTSDANLVGKLFFNVVQTKCFVFKTRKTCVQRSWWGKCQKKKRLKQAILRDNMPY